MQVKDFDFELPQELIAQTPLEDRDQSRLLVLDKETGNITHKLFYEVIDFLESGDTLVLNDTRVMPARLYGVKEHTGANIELLLLKQIEGDRWETLCKPAKRVKEGTVIEFGDGLLKARCVELLDEGGRIFEFMYEGIFYEVLDELGEMPLPPYITEKLDDQERYQTVYSKNVGSAAAPTAGLHFTKELMEKVQDKGIHIAYVTLHVGLGTFRPVSVDTIDDHTMHAEYYQMSEETANHLNEAKITNKRIITVGTTSTRTLETIALKYDGKFKACSGWTDIFIYPGYKFKAIDSLITNFHLPKSTLVMMVSALAGRDKIMNAYHEAIDHKYRFFSFGDAMFIK